ncbi:yml020w-like protein [Moniliophthora roreri MCA 2997]|uniref:Yml020w-like protein n=1 Tax=Moniliophthora roreri (strain MCA 2997) TaxID=1381753 RepID=V2XKD6_MONRO|nr:yml020w-like protein [Moniliophthora roreri MCA 2997]
MNLDEDEETPVGQAVKGTEEKPKNKDIERLKKSEEGKGGGRGNRPASVRSAPAVAPILNSSEPEKKIKKEKSKEHKEIKKGAPPTIIVSDTVRQEGESLLGKDKEKGKKKSPAPSVKSAPPNTTTSPSSPSTTEKKDKGRKSSSQPPPATKPAPPNLVLPTWADTFHTPPRSTVPPSAHKRVGLSDKDGSAPSVMGKLGRVGKWLLGSDQVSGGSSKRPGLRSRASSRSVHVVGNQPASSTWEEWAGKGSGGTGKEGDGAEGHVRDVLRGCKRVVVIGIHGWFPGAVMRTMLGEPTGTSPKFVNMMVQALEEFQEAHGVKLEKITKIPLEGEGTIDRRVEKLYNSLLSNEEWMSDLHEADAIFVSTHSQGSVVSTHLLDRLIKDGHIRTVQNTVATEGLTDLGVNLIPLRPQRVCCLALCGIHLGPLRYLRSSAIVQPYIQYFESAAARELFEFQNTENEVSKSYVKALRNVVNNGTKMVYVASLDDQVVPIYSGLFTSASHPLILRALYIDGNAYSSSDFLSNLLVLLLRILNCGLSDSGLLAHLSEVTAGSLNGVGHSTAYEELSTYALAVNYLFLTNDGLEEHPDLQVEPFNATAEQNDYEIPWALRDLIANERVAHFFSHEITQLRDAFHEWNPKTASLRDIKRKLQPIQRLPSTFSPGASNSVSKL